MSICMMCHKKVPNGIRFCDDCQLKMKRKADESYLDSLLNSVSENPKKKPTKKIVANSISSDVASASNSNKKKKYNVFTGNDDISNENVSYDGINFSEEINEPQISEPLDDSSQLEMPKETELSSEPEISEMFDASSQLEIPEETELPSEPEISELLDASSQFEMPMETEFPSEPEISELLDASSQLEISDEPDIASDNREIITRGIYDEFVEEIASDELSSLDNYFPGVEQTDILTENQPKNQSEISSNNPEMDEMLGSLLADMDEFGYGDGTDEPESIQIEEDDLENIFNEAANAVNFGSENAYNEEIYPEISSQNEPDDMFEEISASVENQDLDSFLFDEAPETDVNSMTDFSEAVKNDILSDSEIMEDKLNEFTAPEQAASEEIADEFGKMNSGDLEGLADLGLGPGDIAALNGEDNGLVNIAWTNDGDSSASVSVDADMDALFSEVNEGDFIDISDAEDLAGILGEPDENLDKLMDEISNGDFPSQDNSETSEEETETSDTGKKKKKNRKKDSDTGAKPKVSLWKRLFGNIVEEVSPEQIEAEKQKEEKAAQEKKEKAELDKKKAEAKKAKDAADKAKAKAEAEMAKKKKDAEKAAKKAKEKEKAKQKKEAALALAEYEVEHGRINKAGATILFVIFAVLTIIIIIGTNIYSYNLSIENAQRDFDVQKYNEAYYEVYGLKIQDEDIELYDRIMTVMYVNTQLNSYNYYMKSNNREKALDSLLKGLQRYDKYLQLAIRLDIRDDLNYVRSQIIDELNSEFGLTEQDAYDMVIIDDEMDYSEYIYGLLGNYEEELENMRINSEILND